MLNYNIFYLHNFKIPDNLKVEEYGDVYISFVLDTLFKTYFSNFLKGLKLFNIFIFYQLLLQLQFLMIFLFSQNKLLHMLLALFFYFQLNIIQLFYTSNH